MLMKSGLFLFLLAVLQVSARYKNVEPDFIENVIKGKSSAESSSSSRIISGWEALPGQHPHHAALRFVNAVGGIRQCGGSIVSKEWVITAAFCTSTRILAIVRAGGVALTNPEYIFESSEWYNHPGYNNLSSAVQQHDISLLKLQRPVVYTRLVRPIRVQSSADAYRDYDGEQVYASGHGRTETTGPTTDVLRWVYLRAISNAACSRTSSNVHDTIICAQYYNVTSQSTCFDDNGGPLVHVGSDSVPTLIGVSNYFPSSTYGCDVGRPTGYTRPGPYLPWFQEVTGIDFENLKEDDNIIVETTIPTTIVTIPDPTTNDPTTNDPTTNTPTATSPTTTTITDATTTPVVTSTESGDQDPDGTIAPPEDSEEIEDDSDSDGDDMTQLLKRLEVNVKVKVRFDKYNVTQGIGNEISV